MPPASVVKRRGKPVRVRTKTMPNGQKVRIYIFRSKGKRGGRTWAEPVKSKKGNSRGKAKR